MMPEDFYKLVVGQKIYFRECCASVEGLNSGSYNEITFYVLGNRTVVNFNNVCSDLSFEQPKPKEKRVVTLKRYWVEGPDGFIFTIVTTAPPFDAFQGRFYPVGGKHSYRLTACKLLDTEVIAANEF